MKTVSLSTIYGLGCALTEVQVVLWYGSSLIIIGFCGYPFIIFTLIYDVDEFDMFDRIEVFLDIVHVTLVVT